MGAVAYVDPYIERGRRTTRTKKITVSIPRHVLKILSDERTRRQVRDLSHATNSELLCEAFLHAFTGQSLPTDEELRNDMKKAAAKSTKKTGTAKAAAKPAAKKSAKKPAKKAAKKTMKAAAKKKPAKKSAAKKPAKKAAKKK